MGYLDEASKVEPIGAESTIESVVPDASSSVQTSNPAPSGIPDVSSPVTMPGDAVNGDGRPGEGGVSVQSLYPDVPEGGIMPNIDVASPTGASVTTADDAVTEQDTSQASENFRTPIGQGIDAVQNVGEGEQTSLTMEQQVDAELTRILGQDSPLLAQARQEAMRMANARGLQNTSMATGMAMDSMTKAALPMAQQNAAQAFERETANTELRQQAGLFSAQEESRLRAIEAELGQELSLFNSDQLNQAERLTAELRTAIEQGNASAFNEASLQLADLQREAEAQQAELDFASAEREFLENQAYQEQVLDAVSKLNEQYMIGEQQIDLQHVIGTYSQLTSMNETAATLMDSYLRSIGNIYDDPKMSSSQAGEAIRNMVTMLEGSLSMLQEMNGMEFDTNIVGGSSGGGGGGGGTIGDR